jgi:hypothetical protein
MVLDAPQHDPLLQATQRAMHRRRAEQRWRLTLAALAGLVVALAAVAVIAGIRGHGSSTTGGTAGRSAGAPATTLPTTPGTPGGPTITSISPSQGPAGTSVAVTGTGFFSPDGSVLVAFGGTTAPTSCSSQTACRATVPSGTGVVVVTVTTQKGTSNGVPFTYQ